ncbi:EamA family transporter [Alginatibacterium sediminis]|uniref:EamA family transporter n=1 Tax=Alginatibacterium sediminis TaxID=2164068 RepID=UPI001F2334A9|nr:EamA family transporter [Alginatibacterium sediminis]
MKAKDICFALLVVVIWGVNFSVIKMGLEQLPPLLFSGLRFAVVALPAVFFVPRPKTSFWNVLAVGLFLGVFKFGLLFVAMQEDASAGLSSLILQAQVFFTIALSYWIFSEKLNRWQVFGIAVALVGFLVFALQDSAHITQKGLVLILSAALFWAFSNLIMKRMQGVNILHFMVWVSLVPPLPLFLLSYFSESQQPLQLLSQSNVASWLSLGYVAYISTLVAFALWGQLLKQYSAASVTPFALLIPVVGIASSALWLDEQLALNEILGAGLIMLGLSINVLLPVWIRVRNDKSDPNRVD